jgi:hypothetical protein
MIVLNKIDKRGYIGINYERKKKYLVSYMDLTYKYSL